MDFSPGDYLFVVAKIFSSNHSLEVCEQEKVFLEII